MKRSRINPRGKVSKRREANLAAWKREHPKPDVCENCGMAPDWRGLALHHMTKRSQGGDESDGNLKWLCGRCHSAEHGITER